LNGFVSGESQLKLTVLEELHRAFDSGLDGASERQRNLLSYLVTEELEGRGDRLKAYSIATEVFGRSKDFDPQTDSIVRVEVGRLRKALERYYLTEGQNASIVISIPKGQYRPVFDQISLPPPQSASPAAPGRKPLHLALLTALTLVIAGAAGTAAWKIAYPSSSPPMSASTSKKRGPVVAIAPFEFHSDREGQDYVAGGLQADLGEVLSGYQWLTVIPLNDESSLAGGGDAIARPDFIVRGSLRLFGDQVKATVLLLDGVTREIRWTKSYDFRLRAGEVMAMQRDLVSAIGRDVGNPFGIVADIAHAQFSEAPSDDAFVCQLRALHYWKTFKSHDYAPARRCFDEAAAKRPLDANSLAMDAILTLDPLSLRFSGRTLQEARAEAAGMALRAYDMNGVEFFPRAARYISALCVGDVDAFRTVARETVERFPNNPVALADVGSRFVLGSGDAEEGVPLIEKSRAISPDLTPVDTVAIAVDALRRGVHENRPRLKRAAAQTDYPVVLIIELALAAARADFEEAARVRQRLSDLGFADQKSLGEALDSTCWSQNVRDLVKTKMTLAFRDARAQ
jgi:TolB-like protein